MPEITKEQLALLNASLANKGQTPVKVNNDPFARGLTPFAPKTNDPLTERMATTAATKSAGRRGTLESAQDISNRLNSENEQLSNTIKTASTKLEYTPSLYPNPINLPYAKEIANVVGKAVGTLYDKTADAWTKFAYDLKGDANFNDPRTTGDIFISEKDKQLKKLNENNNSILKVNLADSQLKDIVYNNIAGKPVKQKIRDIEVTIGNTGGLFKNWEGYESLNTIKNNLAIKEADIKPEDIARYNSFKQSDKNTAAYNALMTKFYKAGAILQNMTYDEGEGFFDDDKFNGYINNINKGGVKANDKSIKHTNFLALSGAKEVISQSIYNTLQPLAEQADGIVKDMELKQENLTKLKASIKTNADAANYNKKAEEFNAFSKQNQTVLENINKEFQKADDNIKQLDGKLFDSDYLKARKEWDDNVKLAETSASAELGNRLYAIGEGIRSPFTSTAAFFSSDATQLEYSANYRRKPMSWNTGEFDKDGNPVMSGAITYMDAQGDRKWNLAAVAETAATQIFQMASIGKLTTWMAKGAANVANISKVVNGASKVGVSIQATERAILNSPLWSRVLTAPAVAVSTYGKTYFDNMGKFKTTAELKEYAGVTTLFESLSETVVPDVNIMRGLQTGIPKTLSSAQKLFYKDFYRAVAKGGIKDAWVKSALQTAGKIGINTLQEAIVEEEANYIAGALYEQYKKGENKDYVSPENHTVQGAWDLALEGTATMLPSMFLGMRTNYKHFQKENSYDFAKPKMLSFHRWNVATNANYFREEIANDDTLTPEEKHKATAGIASYENLLKQAGQAIKKPDTKTLGKDEENLYIYFDALSNKHEIEPKILAETASKEQIELFDNSQKAIELIDKENKDWIKLTPEQKQDKWFNWYGEGILGTTLTQSNLKNSMSAQMLALKDKQKEVEELYKDKQISKEIYEKYNASHEKTLSKIKETAVENFNASLEDENLSLLDLSILYYEDLPRVMKLASQVPSEREDFFYAAKAKLEEKNDIEKKRLEAIDAKEAAEVEAAKAAEVAAANPAAPVLNPDGSVVVTPPAVITPEVIVPQEKASKFDAITAIGRPGQKQKALEDHFEATAPENLKQELIDYLNHTKPAKYQEAIAALEQGNNLQALKLIPANLHTIVKKINTSENAAPAVTQTSNIDVKKAELTKANDEVQRIANIRSNDKVVRQAIIDSNNKKITLEELDAITKKWDNENGMTEAVANFDKIKAELTALEKPITNAKTNVEQIADLRAEEQAEYAAMSNPNDAVERKKIYEKYDKLITPLIRLEKADIEKRRQEELEAVIELLPIIDRDKLTPENWVKKLLHVTDLGHLISSLRKHENISLGEPGGKLNKNSYKRAKVFTETYREFFENAKLYLNNINTEYDAELDALKNPAKAEQAAKQETQIPEIPVPSQTSPEEAEGEDEAGFSYRPMSGMITISDEFTGDDKEIDSPFNKLINEYLTSLQGNESSVGSKLVSNAVLFSEMGVKVKEIRAKLNEYWALDEAKRKETKEEYKAELNKLFKNTIAPSAVAWHLEEGNVFPGYGENIKGKDKFDSVTMRTFTFIVTNKKTGKIVKVNKGKQPIVRALPKIMETPEGYRFYSIFPLSYDEIQQQMKQLYNIQQEALTNQEISRPTDIVMVSNGFIAKDSKKVKVQGEVEAIFETEPGFPKGSIREQSTGKRLFSSEIRREDLKAVAYLLSHMNESPLGMTPKQVKDYVYKIVFLSQQEIQDFSKMTQAALEDEDGPLASKKGKTRRYNTAYGKDGRILDEEFAHITVDTNGQVVQSTTPVYYRTFAKSNLFRYDVTKDIKGGNKKIYFSLAAVKEEATPLSNEIPIPSNDDWVVTTPSGATITVADLKKKRRKHQNDLNDGIDVEANKASIAKYDAVIAKAKPSKEPVIVSTEATTPSTEPTIVSTEPAAEKEKPSGRKPLQKRNPRHKDTLNTSTPSEATTDQELEAFEWFKDSFLSEGIDLNLSFLENAEAFASFSNTAYTLFKGSNHTMLYHEAWHRFTQHFLSKEEKDKLYDAVAKITKQGDEYNRGQAKEFEEALAEAFRMYMKGEDIVLIVGGRSFKINPEAKSPEYKGLIGMFKKMFNFIKGLFVKKDSSITAEQLILNYMREAKKPKTLRTSNNYNSFFTTLNTAKQYTYETEDGVQVTFDYAALYELNQAIDYMFVDEFNKHYSTKVSSLLYAKLKDRKETSEAVYDEVYNRIVEIAQEQVDDKKYNEFKAVIDNWSTFVRNASEFRTSLTTKLKYEEKEEKEEATIDSDTIGLNAEFFENLSNYQHAAAEVINAVKVIPKLDKNGNKVLSSYWGLPQLDDFNKNWTILSKNLASMTFPEMEVKLNHLANTKYPQFKFLLETISPTYGQGALTPIAVRNKFEQVFNMANVPEMITLLSTDPSGMQIIKFLQAGTNISRELTTKWDGEYSNRKYQQVLPNGDKRLNIPKILGDFPLVDLIETKKRMEFLKAIGIEYTHPEDVKAILDSNSPAYKDFLPAIKRVHDRLTEMKDDVIIYPLSSLSSMYNKKKDESKSVKLFAALEVETNEEISDDQSLRADGNSAWKYMQNSYITNFSKDLNKLSLEELIPLYPQLNYSTNPEILNSLWFNSLFIKEEGVWKKRPNNSFEYIKIGGLKSEDISEGEVTIDLSSSDKLVMDFFSFITNTIEENVKFADKSTTAAIKLTSTIGYEKLETPEEVLPALTKQLIKQLVGEVAQIQYINSIPMEERKNIRRFGEYYESPDFIYFKYLDPILLERVKTAALKEGLKGKEIADPLLQKELEEVIYNHYKNKATEFSDKFEEAYGDNKLDYSKLFPSKYNTWKPSEVFEYYYMYSTINRIEQFNFIYGSPRNYKDGADVFKRLAAYGGVGKYASTDEEYLNWSNSQANYQRNIEKLYTGEHRKWDDKFNITHFQDEKVNIPQYSQQALYNLDDDKKPLVNKNGKPAKHPLYNPSYTEEERVQLLNYYNNGAQTDASGNCTLDFYRQFLNGIGEWTPKQDNAYNLQLEVERTKLQLEKEDTAENLEAFEEARKNANAKIEDLTSIFNVKKLQYSGSIYSEGIASKLDLRAFEKFSVAPLIPSVIYGTRWEKIAENMYMNKVDMTNFNSGSKMNWDQKAQKFDTWHSNKITEYTPSTLSLAALKEQLPIDNEMKEENIFASQMRKLLSQGLFNEGEEIEGREKAIEQYKIYKATIDNITNIIKEELKSKLSSPKKLAKYIQNEFGKRDIPDHVQEFVQYYEAENRLATPLDLSFQSIELQNVLFSIANNKLIKQKLSGGQFIQAPNTGYINSTEEDVDRYKNGDLKFYGIEDGNVRKMEIKIAFSDKYKGLLNIVYNNKRIDNLDNLNELLKDEVFVKEHGAKFTLVGCRIPVQGFSTIESMVVKQFLPAVAGQIVIVPEGLTVKSGSDFDIDKLNLYEPHLDENGNLISVPYSDISSYTDAEKIINDFEEEIKQLNEDNEILREKYVKTEELEALDEELEEAYSEEPVYLVSGNLEDLKASFENKKAENPKRKELLKAKLNLETLEQEGRELFNENNNRIKTIKGHIKDTEKYKGNIMSSQVNILISAISNIVLDRGNFLNLITPNELDVLGDIYTSRGIKKNDTPLHNVVDPITSNEFFRRNTVGKQSLGIAAKTNTFFALAVEAGLKMNNPSPSLLSLPENPNGSLSSLYTQPSISGKNGVYIPKVISEFISGLVDIANDSRISEIYADKLRTPIYLYMIMKGSHPEDAINFLMQPNILTLVKKYQRQSSIIYKQFITGKFKSKAAFELLKSKVLKDEMNKHSITLKEFTIFVLDEKGKPKENKKGELIIDYLETAKNIVKNEQSVMQVFGNKYLLDIAQFYVLLEDTNKITELSTAVSWDTNTAKSFVEISYPKMLLNEIKSKEWFNVEAIEYLQNQSVIAPLEISDFVTKQFGNSFAIINKNGFKEAVIDLYSSTFGNKLEDFSRDFQNGFFTYLFQNFASTPEGNSLYQSLLMDLKLLDKNNPDNIQARLKSALSKIKDPSLKANSFLNKLVFRKDKGTEEEAYNSMVPELKNSNIDVHTANLLHQDLLKLYNYPNEKLRATIKQLIQVTALLNGTNKTFRGFQTLIPTDAYTELFRDILSVPELQKQLNDSYSNLYRSFIPIFQENKIKYFPRMPKSSDYNSLDRFNYFSLEIRNLAENVVSLQEMREYTPENITSLKPNEVFVFGANTAGGHGGGTAGLAQRGTASSNYTALPIGTKGKWSEYGIVDKLMQGTEGKSFGIVTKAATISGTSLKIGAKRSVSLSRIEESINALIKTANENSDLKFLVTKFGTNMAGFSIEEMKSLLQNKNLPNNIILPKEFEVREEEKDFPWNDESAGAFPDIKLDVENKECKPIK